MRYNRYYELIQKKERKKPLGGVKWLKNKGPKVDDSLDKLFGKRIKAKWNPMYGY